MGAILLAELIGDLEFLGEGTAQPLDAMRCDLLSPSGLVDPLRYIDAEHRDILRDPGRLFPLLRKGQCLPWSARRDERDQYELLVLRQLRCGKVRLRREVFSGASIFAVGKKGKDTQREVWNSRELSAIAERPPVPPHLASPSALLYIEASKTKPLRIWKRDARCWFDQLKLPERLQPYFGRPPLTLGALRSAHLHSAGREAAVTTEEMRSWCGGEILPEETLVHLCSCIWAMGFSWSAYLAQSTLLHHCFQAGLSRDLLLAEDLPPPSGFLFPSHLQQTMS